jgi:hypothetical protein
MKGFYLQFSNVHNGRLFTTYEDAKSFADGMNSVGVSCPYTISEV